MVKVGNMQEEVGNTLGEMGSILQSLIKSQPFSEPVPLNCELHSASQSPTPPLLKVGQDGYRALELSISLPPGQLGSNQTPTVQALVK